MNPPLRILTAVLGLAAHAPQCAGQPNGNPLLAGNVAVPFEAGSLLLRELTQPPGLFVWTTLRDLESLNAAQLRTLAHGLWKAQQHGTKLAAAPMVIEAWAERDLAGLVKDMLTLMQWEQSSPENGGKNAGLESSAAALWCRLAHQNWKQALPLLDMVGRDGAGLDFWLPAAAELSLPVERLPVFLTTAGKGMNSQHLIPVVDRIMWSAVKVHGPGAAARAVAKIRDKDVRKLAESALHELRSDPPFRAGEMPRSRSPQSPPRSPVLRRLLSMDTAPDEQRRIPFMLLRAVLQLPAADAMALAKTLPRENPPGHWLAWMLFMRTAEEDPVAADAVAAETAIQLVRASQPVAALYAWRPALDTDTALREIRNMDSPDVQRQALSGFLTGIAAQEIIAKELGNPVMGYASQLKLPAEYWRAGLCRAAASGAGAPALRLAGNLPWEPPIGRAMLREDIAKAWALADLPSLQRYAAALENPDDLEPVTKALAFVLPLPRP
jgi:hypothetical protein